jgi:hypothetical protein
MTVQANIRVVEQLCNSYESHTHVGPVQKYFFFIEILGNPELYYN